MGAWPLVHDHIVAGPSRMCWVKDNRIDSDDTNTLVEASAWPFDCHTKCSLSQTHQIDKRPRRMTQLGWYAGSGDATRLCSRLQQRVAPHCGASAPPDFHLSCTVSYLPLMGNYSSRCRHFRPDSMVAGRKWRPATTSETHPRQLLVSPIRMGRCLSRTTIGQI
jgi:hypothetical protein